MDLLKASFTEITNSIKTKKVSAVEVSQFFLSRIEKNNSALNAFVTMDKTTLDQAKLIDQKVAKGEDPGLLAGVPWGIKDMFCTRGLKSTAASKILENFVPPYDATVVAKLKSHGAVILGKLNQDEFAMGSSNETSAFGPCRNPWNTKLVPGGSSGGSAAAQAARLCAGSTGTDTGGSIRQPASFCGIVGVKPTYGRVSRYGIISYASSLDQAGPMTNNVQDAALALQVISGRDERDSTSANVAVPQFAQALSPDVKGMKIGILKEYMSEGGLSPNVHQSVTDSIEALKKMGAEIVEVSVPLTKYSVAAYYLVAASEASSNLARYDGVKYGYRANFESLGKTDLEEFYCKTRGEGFGREVQRRIMLGTYCLSAGYYDAFYNKAGQVRRLLRDQFSAAFAKCDVILGAVTTAPAFPIGDRISDPLAMYLNDIFTVATNLAGLPGMSVPFGMSKDHGHGALPIGVQLMAAHFQEQKMLNVGMALESAAKVPTYIENINSKHGGA